MLAGVHPAPIVAQVAFSSAAVAALKVIGGGAVRIGAGLIETVNSDREEVYVGRQRIGEACDNCVKIGLVESNFLTVRARERNGEGLGRGGDGDGAGEFAVM